MKLQVVATGQFSAPRVIHDDRCPNLRSLHHRLDFAAVLCAPPNSLYKEIINGALVIAIAALEERVCIKDELQTVFGRSTFKEILPDSLWDQDDGKEQADSRHKIQMVERDHARTVYRAAADAHLSSALIGRRQDQQAQQERAQSQQSLFRVLLSVDRFEVLYDSYIRLVWIRRVDNNKVRLKGLLKYGYEFRV